MPSTKMVEVFSRATEKIPSAVRAARPIDCAFESLSEIAPKLCPSSYTPARDVLRDQVRLRAASLADQRRILGIAEEDFPVLTSSPRLIFPPTLTSGSRAARAISKSSSADSSFNSRRGPGSAPFWEVPVARKLSLVFEGILQNLLGRHIHMRVSNLVAPKNAQN